MRTITEIAQEVIDFKLDVLEKYIDEKLSPLLDFGTPEKYLKKKYGEWTPEDEQFARVVFGDQKIHELKVNYFNKQVKKLEDDVAEMEGR